jgi:hypothetical protein
MVGLSFKGTLSIDQGTIPSLAPTYTTILLITLLKPLSLAKVDVRII